MNRHDMNYGKLVVLGDIASDLLQDAEWWGSDDEELVDAYDKLFQAFAKASNILSKRTTKDSAE
jgi:hypothetical protein